MRKQFRLLIIVFILVASTMTVSAQKLTPMPNTLVDLLNIVADDVDDFWQDVLSSSNRDYKRPTIELSVAKVLRTACGRASHIVGPVYCNVDNTIYLPQKFVITQSQKFGDFAVMLIVAHEWGHAIQAQTNTLRQSDLIVTELQSDCFAGAYMAQSVVGSKLSLDRRDVARAAALLFVSGDDDKAWFDPQIHGTGKQRVEAYRLGLAFGYHGCLPD